MKRTLFLTTFMRVSKGYGQRQRSTSSLHNTNPIAGIGIVFTMTVAMLLGAGCVTMAPEDPVATSYSFAAPVSTSAVPEIARNYEVLPGESVEGPACDKENPPEPVPLPDGVQPDAPGAPALWPVANASAPIISWFGMRGSAGGGGGDFHKGMDIKGDTGDPIVAAGDGVVKFSGTMRGYGQLVVVGHADGFETAYAHMNQRLTEVGQSVKGGDTLGLMGATGNASAVHLHYEVRFNSKPLDPNWFLPAE